MSAGAKGFHGLVVRCSRCHLLSLHSLPLKEIAFTPRLPACLPACLPVALCWALPAGAAIRTYLLERSRVVNINDPERNYHVFYQVPPWLGCWLVCCWLAAPECLVL